MRFTALLFLAALAGILVCAQNSTPVQEPVTRLGIGKGLGVEKGLELAKGAREKLREKFEDGKKLIEEFGVEKGLELATGARGRLRERFEDGKKFLESLWVRKVSG
ncbi:extracellular glycoprotein lacritin isoform X2 [Vicugna pacos]|uniref:Extracellular glycoprotein lacritin isoform X2 n=1 Tax=Vicugna pacos TaxID=30538 RepID=A0ABM5EA32_VICPA